MNTKSQKILLEDRIQLACEWKASGLSQVEFAKLKGISLSDFRYQIRYVRERAPERIDDSVPTGIQFAPVSPELIGRDQSDLMEPTSISTEDPVLTVQFNSVNLYVTNQIDPSLLKTALEVIMSC